MNDVRQLSRHARGPPEKEIQDIDAVRSNVEKRATSGFHGIEQPTALARSVEPHVIREFGNDRVADCAGFNQLLCALHLGIATPVIGDSKCLSTLLRGLDHGASLGLAHCQWLLTNHMLARAKGGNGLRRVQKDRRSDVHSVQGRIRERLVQSAPGTHVELSGFGGIARYQSVKHAARLRLNGRNYVTSRNVSNPNHGPVQHWHAREHKMKGRHQAGLQYKAKSRITSLERSRPWRPWRHGTSRRSWP